MASLPGRFAAWLAGLWAGTIAAIGFVAAPTLFAALARADAGRVVARLFEIDAYIGLAAGAILLMLAMRASDAMRPAGSSRFSVELMLVLAALFCIVAGHFAVQPMIESVRRGEAGPSFALLHGVATLFFVVKFVAVAVLAWRLTARRGARAAGPTS
ncbi:MAG: DUF4149 domain-containing protein [Pseudomonadota bacterium]|nr:DUF4149 domain-containing protein [Pseudomonadota bacterium]